MCKPRLDVLGEGDADYDKPMKCRSKEKVSIRIKRRTSHHKWQCVQNLCNRCPAIVRRAGTGQGQRLVRVFQQGGSALPLRVSSVLADRDGAEQNSVTCRQYLDMAG